MFACSVIVGPKIISKPVRSTTEPQDSLTLVYTSNEGKVVVVIVVGIVVVVVEVKQSEKVNRYQQKASSSCFILFSLFLYSSLFSVCTF